MPNTRDQFILFTDASNEAIGAELLQLQEGEERVIAYGSSAMTPEQRRYCVTRRELLAVIKFTRQYRHYLLGRPFVVRTDHSSLTWLLNFRNPQGQLACWMEELSQYDMHLEHRPGKKHGDADALSRRPLESVYCEEYRAGVRLENLPCGGCSHCAKAHRTWANLGEVVDYVVPLAIGDPKRASAVGPERGCEAFTSTHAVISIQEEGPHVTTDADQIWGAVVPQVGADGAVTPPQERLKAEQEADSQLLHLRQWFDDRVIPSEDTIMLWGPAKKYLWINREAFNKTEGLICMRQDHKDRVVVPRSLVPEVMHANHDLPAVGHAGRDRTRVLLKERYFWYGMTKDVKEYVRSCPKCNQNKKATRHGHSPMRNYHAGAPLEKVHLDFLVPLPKSSRGNEHILMMVDQFSKWVECVPLPSQTAEQTARGAVREFFSRFGYPLAIFTDQGRNFESNLFKELC